MRFRKAFITSVILFIFLSCFPTVLFPQRYRDKRNRKPIITVNLDSISVNPVKITPNPYLLPPVFKEDFAFDYSLKPIQYLDKPTVFPQEQKLSLPWDHPRLDSLRKNVYLAFIHDRVDKVRYSKSDLEKIDREEPEQNNDIFRKIFEVEIDADLDNIDPIKRFMPKQRFWSTNGSSLLQFSQNYISDNWYKGGVGNLNLTSVQKFSANYRKDRISFNNQLEWKLSFYTNPHDSVDFRLGDDLFRTYSDFGIQAFNNNKKWSYSINLELKTQLFRNYNNETNLLSSSFLSPVYINMGILGMKYELKKSYSDNKYRQLKLSADVSPLSVQYAYIVNDDIDPVQYAYENNKRYMLDLGSTVNANVSISFNRQVSFSSRFKFFTNYDKVLVESENELNLALSRFFSTRFYVYARFDDAPGLKKDDKLGLLQLNELFSFGFNYKW